MNNMRSSKLKFPSEQQLEWWPSLTNELIPARQSGSGPLVTSPDTGWDKTGPDIIRDFDAFTQH